MNPPIQQTQGGQDIKQDYTPRQGKPFNYDPNLYMKSSLVMANKRALQAPTNFIGKKTFRPGYTEPIRTYNAGGLSGPYKFTGPVLRTEPVQPKFQ